MGNLGPLLEKIVEAEREYEAAGKRREDWQTLVDLLHVAMTRARARYEDVTDAMEQAAKS